MPPGNLAHCPAETWCRTPATVKVSVPSSTHAISRVAGAWASPPTCSPGSRVNRHSSAAHGGSVAAMIVPVPPSGPCHSTRDSAGPVIRTLGSSGTSTRRVTGTPNASLILASVPRFGLERLCSSATSTPLLTPDLAASWSRDQPRSARRNWTVRARALERSAAAAIGYPLSSSEYGRYSELSSTLFRPTFIWSTLVVVVFGLAAAVLYGSADF